MDWGRGLGEGGGKVEQKWGGNVLGVGKGRLGDGSGLGVVEPAVLAQARS